MTPNTEANGNIYSAEKIQKNISQNKSVDASNIWEEISKEYDIRNASFDDLCTISAKLYEEDQIPLLVHGILTFNPNESPQSIKVDINLTQANQDGNRDWIAEYESRSERDLRMSNNIGYMNNQKIINILKRLI